MKNFLIILFILFKSEEIVNKIFKYSCDLRHNALLKEFQEFINLKKKSNLNFFDFLKNKIKKKNLLFELFFKLKFKDSTEFKKIFNINDTDYDIFKNKDYYFLLNLNKINNISKYYIYYPDWLENEIYSNYELIFKKEKIFKEKEYENLFLKKYMKFGFNEKSKELNYNFILNDDINDYNPYFIYNFYPELYIEEEIDFDRFKYILVNKFNYKINQFFADKNLLNKTENLSIYLTSKIFYFYFNIIDYLELIIFSLKIKDSKDYILYDFSPKNLHYSRNKNKNYLNDLDKKFYINFDINYEEIENIKTNKNPIVLFNKFFEGDFQFEFYKMFYLYFSFNKSKLNNELKDFLPKLSIIIENNKLLCNSKYICYLIYKIIELFNKDEEEKNFTVNYLLVEHIFSKLIFPWFKYFNEITKTNNNIMNKNNFIKLNKIFQDYNKESDLFRINPFKKSFLLIIFTNFSYLINKKIFENHLNKIKNKILLKFIKTKNNLFPSLKFMKIKLASYYKNLSKKNLISFFIYLKEIYNKIMFFYEFTKSGLEYFLDPSNMTDMTLELWQNYVNKEKILLKEYMYEEIILLKSYIKKYFLFNKENEKDNFLEKLKTNNNFFKKDNNMIENIITKINKQDIYEALKN